MLQEHIPGGNIHFFRTSQKLCMNKQAVNSSVDGRDSFEETITLVGHQDVSRPSLNGRVLLHDKIVRRNEFPVALV